MSDAIPSPVRRPAQPALDRVAAVPGNVPAAQFGILFVCTGNLCRSVIAQRLAQRGLRDRLGPGACRFRVTSAGTAALDGRPVHPYTTEALSRLGADAGGVASHALTAADVDAADLILTAGREHLDAVLTMCPAASRRAYLLRQFARLAAGTAAHRPDPGLAATDQARHLVAEIARLRGRVPYVEPAHDEIAEPASNTAAFQYCAGLIDMSVSQVLHALCGGLARTPYRGKRAR